MKTHTKDGTGDCERGRGDDFIDEAVKRCRNLVVIFTGGELGVSQWLEDTLILRVIVMNLPDDAGGPIKRCFCSLSSL